jgi:hypothetical protein
MRPSPSARPQTEQLLGHQHRLGINPIVTLEKQLLNMIGNLVYKLAELYFEATIGYNPATSTAAGVLRPGVSWKAAPGGASPAAAAEVQQPERYCIRAASAARSRRRALNARRATQPRPRAPGHGLLVSTARLGSSAGGA